MMIKPYVLGDLEHELATTRKVLVRLPEAQYAWQPHPKSMSLGALAAHTANLLYWTITTLEGTGIDLDEMPPPRPAPDSQHELLTRFDALRTQLREVVDLTDDADLQVMWTMRRGDTVLMKQPRAAVLRTFCISHLIHHRAQLGVYLRLLDEPVPNIYGPTADEPQPMG